MTIVDKGHGAPLVLVPGIQGRWEYFSPAVDALAASHRVITFSLSDEPGHTLDSLADQIVAALDSRGIERAAVCGISFGGRIAIRFAARHPDRVSALIVVSTPGPSWRLRPSHRVYARAPWLFVPVFAAGAPLRLRREIAVAIPDAGERRAFAKHMLRLLVTAPISPSSMAARARLIDAATNETDCAQIGAPTLVLTGEPALDHVVPATGTLGYAQLIPGARTATLHRTGHLGSVTRPGEFASLVGAFLSGAAQPSRSGQDAA